MLKCENLKVGDNVFVNSEYGTALRKVEKITPKGFIKVGGNLYTKDGVMRGSGWNWSTIRFASDEEIAEFRKKKFVADVVKKLRSVTNIRYEQAVEINKILFEVGKEEE